MKDEIFHIECPTCKNVHRLKITVDDSIGIMIKQLGLDVDGKTKDNF